MNANTVTETETAATTVCHSYPLGAAIMAANAVLPHASKDDVTPIITAALVTHETWLTTDRYTVAQWTITRPSEGPLATEATTDAAILIPRDAVEWVGKIVAAKLRNYRASAASDLYTVDISQELLAPRFDGGEPVLGDVTVAIVFNGKIERSQTFDAVGGNFPPVARLIENWKPATEVVTQSINPVFLERITTFARRNFKEQPLRMEAGANESTGKPGPMRVTIGDLVALIQPNLLLR